MPLAMAFRALQLVSMMLGARRGFAARLAELDTSAAHLRAAGPEPDGVRVFATSFNAGNKVFEGGAPDFDDLVVQLTDGHEVPGHEADIVLLGFQEFEDKGYEFGSYLNTKALWKRLSRSKQDALRNLSQEITNICTPPEEVKDAKRALTKQLQAFHEGATAALQDFKDKYGPESHDFHKHLADNSPVHALSDNATAEQQKLSAEIRSRLQRYADTSLEKPQTQFVNVSAAASHLAAWAEKYPTVAEIQEKLGPIHAWTEKALVAMQEVRAKKFPNLLYHEQGEALWSSFRAQLDTSRKLEGKLVQTSKAMPDRFKELVESLYDSIEAEVKRVEERVSESLLKDWDRIKRDLSTLSKDLERLIADEKLVEKVATGVKKGTTQPYAKAFELLDVWGGQNSDTMDKILKTVAFDLGQSEIKVRMEPQKFDSGWRCAAGIHYDTVLYAYVNPWSTWKIEPEEYESAKCVKHDSPTQKNMGCNIDNNDGMECGKVVNLLVFKAQNEGSSLRICGLNTHMSFAGTAEQRMTLIAEAMEETRAAKCDAVVFVGDFNSRLHCEHGRASNLPAYEMADGQSSSLSYILSKFCQGENCSMSSSTHTHLDELHQMLNLDTVTCFEQVSEKKGFWSKNKVWRKVDLANTVKRTSLQEAEVPNFAPTYKLVPPAKATGSEPGWSKCFPGEPTCFMNPTKKGKHNPAWTDRILVQAKSTAAKVKTAEYSRRAIWSSFGSDHVPVVAQITLIPV